MFSSGMKEDATGKVQLPDSDPEGWKHYEFVLGKIKHDHAAKIQH